MAKHIDPLVPTIEEIKKINTEAIKDFVLESFDGPVTQKELEGMRNYARNVYTPYNNNGNANVYNINAQLFTRMYEVTKEKVFLDALIKSADRLLKSRTTLSSGIFVADGKKHLVWPHYMNIKMVDQERTVVVEISEGLMRDIPRAARLIAENKELWNEKSTFDESMTYLEKAKQFIKESNASLDDYVLPTFLDKSVMRFVYPTANLEMLDAPSWAGKTPPWNRQFFILEGMADLAKCHFIFDDDSERLKLYDSVIQSTMDYFVAKSTKMEVDGFTCYLWQCMAEKGDDRFEDNGHAGYDISSLYIFCDNGRYKLPDKFMVGIGNTIVKLWNKGDGNFTADIGGKRKGSKDYQPSIRHILPIAKFNPEVYTLLTGIAAKDKKWSAEELSAILYMKDYRNKNGIK